MFAKLYTTCPYFSLIFTCSISACKNIFSYSTLIQGLLSKNWNFQFDFIHNVHEMHYTGESWKLVFILITNKAVRKHASYYTALIMVEYLRWFVLPFSAYPCHYRPPPRGTWGVPTSASVARVTSTRSMTSAGSSMVRWWRKSTTRCYAGNPTGARSAIIFCTDKIITHFPTGF